MNLIHQLFHAVPGVLLWMLVAGIGAVYAALGTHRRRWNLMNTLAGIMIGVIAAYLLIATKTWAGIGWILAVLPVVSLWLLLREGWWRRSQGRPLWCQERPDPDRPGQVRVYSLLGTKPLGE